MNELLRKLLFLPEQASTFAPRIDSLHFFVILTTMVVSTGVGLTALGLFVRYRRRSEDQLTPHVEPSVWFEVGIIVVPLAFFLGWFAIGYRDFVWMTTPPPNTLDVYVTAKKWMWQFAYPEGPNSIGQLRVPLGRPVRLLMTSRDVIHSFYVPAFRVKQDVLPGRYTQLWFEATQTGRFQVFCAEYCGMGHSMMWAEVVVMKGEEFDAWLAEERRGLASRQDGSAYDEELDFTSAGNLVAQGKRLAEDKGCMKCHSIDGSAHIGPSWLDLYRRQEKLASGELVVADEGYLTESMMDPRARVVAGFQPVMPTFQGRLAAADTAALVEFIKSLRSDRVKNERTRGPVYEPITR